MLIILRSLQCGWFSHMKLLNLHVFVSCIFILVTRLYQLIVSSKFSFLLFESVYVYIYISLIRIS